MPAGESIAGIRITFLGEDSLAFAPAAGCETEYMLTCEIADTSVAGIAIDPDTFWRLGLTGKREGTTTVRFHPRHGSHSHFESRPVPITVTAADRRASRAPPAPEARGSPRP